MPLTLFSSARSFLACRSLVWLLLLVSCATLVAADLQTPKPEKEEPSPRQRRYYFEHRLLPKWTHTTNGAFFDDLRGGQAKRMVAAAADIVNPAYAAAIEVKPLADENRVLISFAPPDDPAACFHVLVIREGQGYLYYTLELTEDLLGDGSKAVLGGWSAEGGHQNFGPRKYSDGESFVRDVAHDLPSDPVATTDPKRPKR